MKRCRARVEDFTVAWICALHVELTAAREALDEEYERLDDVAHYTLGRVGRHNVAVACLPAGHLGTSSAAAVAAHMQNAFPALRYGLMVGIAGGVPSKSVDIQLGDVVISHPQGRYGGVVQYDFGKTGSGGQHFPNGSLNSPDSILLQAVAAMRSSINAGQTDIVSYLSALNQRGLFPRPGPETEKLFDPSYNHVSGDTCNSCLKDRVVDRFPMTSHDIVIHYGTIASSNQVVAELTGGGAETVQFIHESVHDYLLTTKRLHRLQRLQVDLSSNFPGASHETLKKSCETYIEIVRSEDPGSGTPSSCLESDPGTQEIKPEDTPSLKYAVRNILFHADAAAEHGVNQERFIDGFPYEQWVKVSDSLVERRTERYGLGVSPLYIFANESVPTLVSSEVRKVPLIDVKGGHYDYPLNAARAHNSKET